MPRKCSVGRCASMYDTTNEKVTVYGFPTPYDGPECKSWITALPNVVGNVSKNIGVCEKHWPKDFTTIRKKGAIRPRDPPSVFTVPNSYLCQTFGTSDRGVKRRKVLSEARTLVKPSSHRIANWDDLVEHCRSVDLNLTINDDHLLLIKMSKELPPTIIYSIVVYHDFNVECFSFNNKVSVRELLGFSAKLEKYAQLDSIITKMCCAKADLKSEVSNFSKFINEISEDSGTENSAKVRFLCEQLQLIESKKHGERYSGFLMKESINIFLKSRNAYNSLRELLVLPHKNTIMSYFGQLGSNQSIQDCTSVVMNVISKLSGVEKHCKILCDEIHIKPGVQYQGGHIIGFSDDEPEKAAKTILALMVAPLLGKPAFVARLIPIYSLKADFLYQQVLILIKIIHSAGGFVYLVMCDNLRTNQSMFSITHKEHGTTNMYSVKHPVDNLEYLNLYLLYDPVHLLKNIRNNWCTEKSQKLRYFDPETKTVATACWSDVINVYKNESVCIVKKTPLNFSTLYPTNFEKQKVSLVLNVFNEKTVVALQQNGYLETARFIQLVLKMWNCLNVKTPNIWYRLNDINRKPIYKTTDPRLNFLIDMATMFKRMDTYSASSHQRIMGLTSDTSNALHITLHGIVNLTSQLLGKMRYVLLGELQSDRLEAEFGIYRQQSGGNFHISVQQALNSSKLQQLKLYNKLEIPAKISHCKQECCTQELSEEYLDNLNNCFSNSSEIINEIERSSLYYICGYIAHKEGCMILSKNMVTSEKESEFVSMVSRGNLDYPTEELFDLSLYLYSFYKLSNDKNCINKMLVAFQRILDFTQYEVKNSDSVLRRFANCFFKSFSNMITDTVKSKDTRNIKRLRLSNKR